MTTQRFKVFKETGVPTTWVANSLYLIKDPAKIHAEAYITSNTAVPTRMINEDDVKVLITAAISTTNELLIVANIAARNALVLTQTISVYVTDATADSSVTTGGAYYIWNSSNSTWIKTAEAESMDVALSWANISGKPSSTVSQIDAAVGNSHTHSNKTQLDKIGEDGSGNPTYNGSVISNALESANW